MTDSISCASFLERYSDYRDGYLEGEAVRARFDAHLANCDRCRTYHVRIARGVLVLQNSGEIEPSPSLRHQLRDRIQVGRGQRYPLAPAYAGAMLGLVLLVGAGVILFDSDQPPPVAASADSVEFLPVVPAPIAEPRLVRSADPVWEVPAFGAQWRSPGAGEEPYIMRASLTR